MRRLLLLIILFTSVITNAQDCNSISRINTLRGVTQIVNGRDITVSEFTYYDDTTYRLTLYGFDIKGYKGKGVIITFENGVTISRPEAKIVTRSRTDNFRHATTISLTDDEIELIKNTLMVSFKLYVIDVEIHNPKQYKVYMNCLKK